MQFNTLHILLCMKVLTYLIYFKFIIHTLCIHKRDRNLIRNISIQHKYDSFIYYLITIYLYTHPIM